MPRSRRTRGLGRFKHHAFDGPAVRDRTLLSRVTKPNGFKMINEEHGHMIGDSILKKTADLVSGVVRDCDITARYGGDEFAIILPNTDKEGAEILSNRICELVDNHEHELLAGQRITIKAGISTVCGDISGKCDQMIQEALREASSAKVETKELLPA